MSILRYAAGRVITGAALMFVFIVGGCTRHTVDVQPIRVEPIHMTLDVNIRVDRELDRFFDFEEDVVVDPASATQPELEVVPATPPADAPNGAEGGS